MLPDPLLASPLSVEEEDCRLADILSLLPNGKAGGGVLGAKFLADWKFAAATIISWPGVDCARKFRLAVTIDAGGAADSASLPEGWKSTNMGCSIDGGVDCVDLCVHAPGLVTLFAPTARSAEVGSPLSHESVRRLGIAMPSRVPSVKADRKL